jgi:GxxExxY protein
MQTDNPDFNALTELVIARALVVLNTLGPGLLDQVYENALAHEMRKAGLSASQQQDITVYYDGVAVGAFTADLLVENAIIVELKVVRTVDPIHRDQCLNYLKATGLSLCLLMNFGNSSLEVTRVAHTPCVKARSPL